MNQLNMFHEDIYSAISTDIQALGGNKKVGSQLWPEKSPDKAGELLANCLNRLRAEKLDPEQLLWIISQARKVVSSAALGYIAEQADYEKPKPIEPVDELARLQRDFINAAQAQSEMLAKIQHMTELGNLRAVHPVRGE